MCIIVTDGGHATANEFEFAFIAIADTLDDAGTQSVTIDAGDDGVTAAMTAGDSASVIFVADDGATLVAGSPINLPGRVQFIGNCGNCPVAEGAGVFLMDGIGTVTINSAITTTDDGTANDNEDISIFGANVVINQALTADESIQLEAPVKPLSDSHSKKH